MNQTELCNQLARSAEDRLLLRRVLDQAVAAERIWQRCPIPDDLTDTLMKELKLL